MIIRPLSLKPNVFTLFIYCYLIFFTPRIYPAVIQFLNDTFFQNPAELSLVNQMRLMSGDLYVAPSLRFTGTSYGQTGSVGSRAQDNLPYLLGGYRLTKRFVIGVNITPSGYGHIRWPSNSIVTNVSTNTQVLYYRSGLQSSYQFTDKLAFGVGLNLQHNKLLELDYVVPGLGQQINKVNDLNFTADVGVFYKFNSRTSLTAAIYSPVNATGLGTSTLNNAISDNLTLNITEAAVAFVGLQHNITDKWFLGEKIYWSGWSLQKNINLFHATTGSTITPTNWKDVWSFQLGTRYVTTEKTALLGSAIYETNADPTITNNIGYPLAPLLSFSGGLDVTLHKKLSTQIIYGYGFFLPNSLIETPKSRGSIAGNFQSLLMQFTYRS